MCRKEQLDLELLPELKAIAEVLHQVHAQLAKFVSRLFWSVRVCLCTAP